MCFKLVANMLFVVCGAIQRGHKIKLQANTCTEHDGAKKKKLFVLKGSSDAKFTLTWCLNINVCWQCLYTYTL